MKKTIPVLVLMIIIISSGGVVWAVQTNYDIGKSAAPELKLGLGARPVALGEAYVAQADDLNATAWNPAGLARIDNTQAGFMHNMFIQETSLEYLAFAQQLFPGAGLGANLAYLSYGSIEKTSLSGDMGEIVGEFTPSVIILSLGYGQQFMENLAVGATVKYYRQNIDTETYSAAAVDVGGIASVGLEGLQIGLAVQNLGTPVAESSLPLNAKAGAVYRLPVTWGDNDQWRVLCDVNLPFGDVNYTSVNLGTEYWYQQLVAARLGYKIKDTGDLGGVTGLTAGLGVKWSLFNLDYAMVSYGDLGLTHQIGLGVSF
ncbi:PorV/PorQ family protein [candidate division FCPU426 bacterium]|nr:PorV/PorQ family protein [candidate division FCPU426 bacterium]